MTPRYIMTLLETGIITATIAVVISLLQWTFTSPWWHDQVGRTVVVKDMGVLLLLIPNMLDIFWRHSIPFAFIEWTDVASLFVVTGAMVWRCAVWYKIRKPWPIRRERHDVLPVEQPAPRR